MAYTPYGWVNNIPAVGYGQPAQNGPQIQQVQGEQGAKAFMLPPNSSALLMDQTDAIVWAKVTDGAGYATLKAFRITPIEIEEPKKEESSNYVTNKDFNELKDKVEKLIKDLGGDSK